jgi:hypothetical protein
MPIFEAARNEIQSARLGLLGRRPSPNEWQALIDDVGEFARAGVFLQFRTPSVQGFDRVGDRFRIAALIGETLMRKVAAGAQASKASFIDRAAIAKP